MEQIGDLLNQKSDINIKMNELSLQVNTINKQIDKLIPNNILPMIYQLTSTHINFKTSKAGICGGPFIDYGDSRKRIYYVVHFSYIIDNQPRIDVYIEDSNLIIIDNGQQTHMNMNNPYHLPIYLLYDKLLKKYAGNYRFLNKIYFKEGDPEYYGSGLK